MRVNTSKAAKSIGGYTRTAEIGHLDLFSRPDHDVFDLPLAVKQDADLSVRFTRYLGHLPGEFRRDDLVRCNSAGRKPLDALELIMLQPSCKAVDRADRLASKM
jgi:hypothetical protein